jgi:hypothetical protein
LRTTSAAIGAVIASIAILIPTVNVDNNQHEEHENLTLGHFFQAVEIIAAVVGGWR